jgi:hypothetical protein
MRYRPDPVIDAEVALDVLAAEVADLAAGYPPRQWRCPCGAVHCRGHFQTVGAHRCLGCGYIGSAGVMVAPDESTQESAR